VRREIGRKQDVRGEDERGTNLEINKAIQGLVGVASQAAKCGAAKPQSRGKLSLALSRNHTPDMCHFILCFQRELDGLRSFRNCYRPASTGKIAY
jgi:hypothetical protein